MAMNKLFKQFVAFAIVAVMLCGLIPVSAMAVEHDHDHQHSDIAPFSSSADLIEQVKAQLAKEGKLYTEQDEDEDLVASVESNSDYTFAEAKTMLGLGFFNNRVGTEGEIGTAHLNLSKTELTALVENVLTGLNMTGIVTYEVVTEGGVATAVEFSLRESFAAGLDDMDADPVVGEMTAAVGTTVVVESVTTTEKAFPFTDVGEKHWARTAINYLYQRDIVSGVTLTTYGPNVKVNRAMAVTILYRVAGTPEHSGKNPFNDVKAGQWYTDAVIWAYENNIVSGIDKDKFGPTNNLTREQLVTFMFRYAAFDGRDVSARGDLSKVKDSSAISSWAKDAMQWAIAEGVIKGYDDGSVKPKGTATRAEFAQVIYTYMVNSHQLTRVAPVAPTCATEGNIEYWVCAKCGKYFADAQAKKEIKKEDTVLAKDPAAHNPAPVPEVSPTCTTTGVAAHYKCACGLTLDAQGNLVTDPAALILPAIGHTPAVDENGNYINTVFNWSEPNGIIVDAEGNVTFDPEVYFVDEDGNPLLSESGTPVNVGYSMGEMAISSISLVYVQNAEGKYEIQMMPTMKPDYWYTWVDEDGDGQMDQDAIVPENLNHRDTFVCDTVTFTCNGCGEEFTKEVNLSNYIMTEDWIDQAVNDYATEVAMQLINDYVSKKAMDYYGQTGAAPSDEMINGWVAEAQADEAINAQITQAATAKAMELYQDMGSVIYVAECSGDDIATFSDSVNATKAQLQKNWATMCKFNEDYSKYFGLVAPYWESKNTETSPMGAVIYMCSMEEQDLVPNMYLDMMVSMLTQAFMSYVYSYAPMLDAMLADAMAAVNYKSLDDIDKLLLLHDWLASNATFDMQSLVDITSGASSGSDPIAMTAFGLLLNDQIQKAPGAMWDGGVCLAYAATYAMLIQQAFGMEQDDAAIVDFAKIQYLTNVAESSVAAGGSGFGDGDAMFNSAHYLNAVKLNDNWYYIDACYDDVNSEVISQYRVETDGNVSHNSFLLAPSTWEEMYEENFQYMDSLYDGKVWQRVYDGESGYYKMDGDRNKYTAAEAAAMEEADPNLQLFYYYEAINTDAETRYEDATYETAWFVSANSTINYDDATGYFYYTSSPVTSYASMKDMFGDAEDGGANSGANMDQADMLQYKYQASSQDKIVRRPVDATNIPNTENNGMGMAAAGDDYAEVLFHFGYGTTGAEAHNQYQTDNENAGGMGGTSGGSYGPYYDLCQEDAEYYNYYPDLTHSTVMMDGKLYFNIANCIYTFNYSVDDLAENNIDNITDLELVKVKEYNEVTYSSNGKRFTGMSFETSEEGSTVYYHPIAALNVHDVRTWEYDQYGTPTERTEVPTLFVSIATNLSNSYKTEVTEVVNGEEVTVEKAYVVEARNYNQDYYRFMEEEEGEEEENTNTEFMWTANIVDKMDVEGMLQDLSRGSTSVVSVAEYCGRNAFTETRTNAYGLSTKDDKVEEEDTALMHEYAYDETEETNICAVCLKHHEHDYAYATASDIDFVWSTYEVDVETEEGTAKVTKLDAVAYIYCGNDDFCAVNEELECTVVENENGSFTATATKGTITATETKTLDQFLHNVHDYGTPVFTWTPVYNDVIDSETGNVVEENVLTGYKVIATFTCEADEADCEGSDAEGDRELEIECEVTKVDGEFVATVIGPGETTQYTDKIHVFSAEKYVVGEKPEDETDDYVYIKITMDEGKDTFTAEYTCTACGKTHTMTGAVVKKVDSEATCDQDGLTTYTANAGAAAVLEGFEDKTFNELPEATLVVEDPIVALGHNPQPTPDWNEDLTECTVKYICASCSAETSSVIATVHRTEVPATCDEDGSITAYAEVIKDGIVVYKTETKQKTLPATGHDYADEATVKWNYVSETAMKVVVYFECENGCGVDKPAEVTTPKVDADGVWSASYVHNGQTVTVKHPHVFTDGVCECGAKRGHEHEYGEWQMDEDKHWKECSCEEKSEEGAHVYTDDADATCNICGYSRHVHTYTVSGEYIWTWDNGHVCRVEGKCSCGAKETAVATGSQVTSQITKAATCSEKGVKTHTATFTETWAGSATTHENLAIDPNNHTWGTAWEKDDSKHWHECTGCHAKKDEADHSYGDDNKCVCGDETTTVNHDHNVGYLNDYEFTYQENGKMKLVLTLQCDTRSEDGMTMICDDVYTRTIVDIEGEFNGDTSASGQMEIFTYTLEYASGAKLDIKHEHHVYKTTSDEYCHCGYKFLVLT